MWLLSLLVACSDYTIEPKPQDPDAGDTAPLVPDIEVSPEALDLGVLCASGEGTLTVTNVGDGELHVDSLLLDGSGWGVTEGDGPFTLTHGQSQEVTVTGAPGVGTVTVLSDDPDEDAVEVPLSAAADTPPTVEWMDPVPGTVLPTDAPTRLAVRVADAEGPLDGLSVSWSSDVDGVLGTSLTDATGLATLDWEPSAHTPGNHTFTVSVADACGAPADVQAAFCQDAGYNVDNLDLSTWNFEGTAAYDSANAWVRLTQDTTNQAGTAFQTAAVVSADDVVIDFLFYAGKKDGADGLALVALDADRMSGFVGDTGGGIGYAGLPGWAIEVDTWYNTEYGDGDPTPMDHIAFHLDGAWDETAWAALPEMEDDTWHTMSVTVAGNHVLAYVDGVRYLDFDSPVSLAFPAYVGFTGATGAATNEQLIDALVVTESVCE